ncbi:amino acid permease [Fusarium albosuccineum]|uniref:Amino acid permease n=1 Tax=Fusarium albosuccineum TaxID=1237068 RepID=A0A8H4LF78_9HYPO|nr:amino acid permease [Fusarium albosuccineum]
MNDLECQNRKSTGTEGLMTRRKERSPSHVPHSGNTDEDILARLGHQQELERKLSLLTVGALCSCLMATWEALATVIASALISGGAPCLFYNYLISFICTMCIALSLADIASVYPTAGGQYHWVAALSPPSTRSAAAWATGWISVWGQAIFSASAAFAAGLQIQGLITMNSDSYNPTRWQDFADYQRGFGGWSNDGVAWLVGLQSAVYPFLGYDAACHLSEELPHASRNVPLAMLGSVAFNGLTGLIYCVVLLFSTQSLDTLLETPTGFPFIAIYLDVTKSKVGATILSAIVPVIATAASVAGMASTSRTLWAFARDKGTPFDKQLSHIHKGVKVPVNAICVIGVLQLLLGLIYLGSSTAFNAILSMAIIGLYLSYVLPIIYQLAYGRRRKDAERLQGWFKSPVRVGITLNSISCAWIVLVIVFSTFPTLMPVTPQNMNYSLVVITGVLFFGIVYYIYHGRRKFEVPILEVSVIEGQG